MVTPSTTNSAIAADPYFVDVPLPEGASVVVENSLIARNDGPSIFSAKRLPNLELRNCTVAGNDRVNRCVDIGAYESDFIGIDDCVVGVEEAITLQPLSISPNPATDLVQIEWPDLNTGTIAVQLFDAQGREIQLVELPVGQPIDVGQLPKGMYLIVAVVEGQIYSGKFLKF